MELYQIVLQYGLEFESLFSRKLHFNTATEVPAVAKIEPGGYQ